MIKTKDLDRIAFATSKPPSAPVAALQQRWTELAVYYRPGERRPFVAETLGETLVSGEQTFRRQRVGKTWDEVARLFDNSRLTDEVTKQVQAWLDAHPAVETPAPRIQFDGNGGLIGGLRWLYEPVRAEVVSDNNLVDQFAEDWGVPSRTVRHQLKQEKDGAGLTPWVKAFIGALMHFDREAFHAARRVG